MAVWALVGATPIFQTAGWSGLFFFRPRFFGILHIRLSWEPVMRQKCRITGSRLCQNFIAPLGGRIG